MMRRHPDRMPLGPRKIRRQALGCAGAAEEMTDAAGLPGSAVFEVFTMISSEGAFSDSSISWLKGATCPCRTSHKLLAHTARIHADHGLSGLAPKSLLELVKVAR